MEKLIDDMLIKINSVTSKVSEIHGYKYKSYFFGEYEIYFFGNFRTNINVIEELIIKNKKILLENNFADFFKYVFGDISLLIVHKEEVKIVSSIYNCILRLFKEENNYFITEKEFINEDFNIPDELSFLKIYCHHSFFIPSGLSKNVKDFILPGSMMIFSNKKKSYSFEWYLDFESFCSRDDHDNIAKDLSQSFMQHENFTHEKFKTKISLSGGLDSALVLAATKNIENVSAFNVSQIFSDEYFTAKNISKKLKKKLEIFYQYGSPIKDLKKDTDIEEILEFNYEFLKTDSVHFFLSNSNAYSKYKLSKCLVLNGNSFPTALTIKHGMKYPNRINRKMEYDTNKSIRYTYSLKYLKELKSKNINLNSYYQDFGIHKYYSSILLTSVNQKIVALDNIVKNKVCSFQSPISIIEKEKQNLLNDICFNISKNIIDKILKSKFFKKELQHPNEITAQILLKVLNYIFENTKSMQQDVTPNDENYVAQSIGLNPNILLQLFKVRIDEKLVNFSKWHLFKAFELISGQKFDNFFLRGSWKNPNYLSRRIICKLFYKYHSYPEFDERFALINNKYLYKFLKDNNIIEKYNDFKSTNKFKNFFYDFPSKKDLMSPNKLEENFWKINNIVNLTCKIN